MLYIEYIKFGFTVTKKNGINLPQCLLCRSVLSIDVMGPGRLDKHLNTYHKKLKDKPKEFPCCQTSMLEKHEARQYRSFSLENGETRGSILRAGTTH